MPSAPASRRTRARRLSVRLARQAPSPRRGEGWGEGETLHIDNSPQTLTLSLSRRERERYRLSAAPKDPGRCYPAHKPIRPPSR
ncbi:hypothetical protein CHELA1G11_11024 [Hyphomicrobiales bacterium]|nr:hypothetical protein CHELA1G11_11024 [Hyphomicrobiales bacterium]CAH1670656.1 hypothetical protein CHELA1G2_13284 [Hyphomicrobiales bacterium]